jgi:very-short-patch-repair endonuclease
LIIEIDGGIHEQQGDYDQIRSELLVIQHDLCVIRFTNEEIMKDMDTVLMRLKNFIIAGDPPPAPPC